MPAIIALIGLLVAAAVWYNRIKMAGGAVGDLKDAANDVRLAARRFGFKRRTDVHPVDAIEDPWIATVGIAITTVQMDGLWNESMYNAVVQQSQSILGMDMEEAEGIVGLARWIIDQGGNPDETIRRMARRLKRLSGADAMEDTVAMIRGVSGRSGRALSQEANEAIETVERVMKSV